MITLGRLAVSKALPARRAVHGLDERRVAVSAMFDRVTVGAKQVAFRQLGKPLGPRAPRVRRELKLFPAGLAVVEMERGQHAGQLDAVARPAAFDATAAECLDGRELELEPVDALDARRAPRAPAWARLAAKLARMIGALGVTASAGTYDRGECNHCRGPPCPAGNRRGIGFLDTRF